MTVQVWDNAQKLLDNVRADYDVSIGGSGDMRHLADGSASGRPVGGEMSEMLGEIKGLLSKVIEMLDGMGQGGTAEPAGTSASALGNATGEDAISGSGRIWGDPHFIGQDGGKYDVQGEAGKSYNLLSDSNFQMNGRFDQYKDKDGLTVVGQVGIAAGSDQIEVSKTGEVMVNGKELTAGDRVELADGGHVEYSANGGGVTVESGEWTTEIDFQNKGDGSNAHLNIDVSTENAIADGVRPHGLLGQTFDADDDARNGDKGKGTQGGGAIEDANGNITARGDRDAIGLYEVDNVHDRNFTEFNQFFDDAEDSPGTYDAEMMQMMGQAFAALGQAMMMMAMQGDSELAA